MSEGKNLWMRLKDFFFKNGKSPHKQPPPSPYHRLIIVLCIGALVFLITPFLSVERDNYVSSTEVSDRGQKETETFIHSAERDENYSMSEYENMYENELKELLEDIVGVGEVTVSVTVESTEVVMVEKNVNVKNQVTKEVDKNNATRDITDQSRDEQVVLVQGEKGEHPIVIKKIKPEVRGVTIVAKGAENLQVKAWILEAVQKALDVPVHKIAVLPKKG